MTDETPKPKRTDLIGDKASAKEAYNPNGIVQARDVINASTEPAYNPNGLTDIRTETDKGKEKKK